jgi:putative ABC transport system permease protein
MDARGLLRALGLAGRGLRRDWRSGELTVIAAALVVAVASISAVGVFTDRVQRGMELGAGELLAADLLVRSSRPIDEGLAAEANRRGIATARTLTFRSVVMAGGRLQLTEAKAVDEGYPLRGELRIADEPFAAGIPTGEIPAPGTVWADPRLLGILDLAVGDRLELGALSLRIDQVLAFEPDRGGDLFSIAPRVMFNLADVPASQLVQAGSRVQHRLLFAGPEDRIVTFRDWLRTEGAPALEVQGVRDARPELRAALERAGQFLGLAALVSVLLAAVAVAMSARRYAERHLDAAAVMRCLGAGQGTVVIAYAGQMLLLGGVASLAGAALGFLAQGALASLLSGLILTELPGAAGAPILAGVATGLVVLVGFALPPLVRLRQVPPIRVLRRELGRLPGRAVGIYLAAIAAFAGLVLWQANDPVLAAWVLAGGTATVAVLALVALALVRLLGPLRRRVGVSWRFGIANIARRTRASVVQVVAFGLGITMLLLLTLVRTDLLHEWRDTLPPDAPNYFLLNIQPEERAAVQEFLAGRGLARADFHPMVRGRLVAINDRPVSADDYRLERAQRLASREFNLSWAAELRSDNRLLEGRWWGDGELDEPWLSIEQGIGDTLGFGLGDSLRFRIGSREVTGRVANVREVDWDSFRVNFFVIGTPGLLEDQPSTWITSFHLAGGDRVALTELVREFPSVTVVDVDALIAKVREIMDQASLGVQVVFLFTVLAGFMVLFAAIQATLDERRYETAVVRTLGASRRRLGQGLLAEFLTLGLLSGLLAALAATLIGGVLADQIFGFLYRPDPRVWLAGTLGGALGVATAGMLGTRSVLRQPPLRTLREA